jgi:hypothetical protein
MQGWNNGGSLYYFGFFLLPLCKQGTPKNENFTKFIYSHLLFAILFVFISPTECCGLEKFVVDFQTF